MYFWKHSQLFLRINFVLSKYVIVFMYMFFNNLFPYRSHKMYSVKASIRSYLCRILTTSGINPFSLFVRFHFHFISLRHGIPWLINIKRLRKYTLRLSISASIVSKPKSPQETDPDVPGRKPCMMRTIMFCTFSKGLFIWAKVFPVSEKTFRQVHKRYLAFLRK